MISSWSTYNGLESYFFELLFGYSFCFFVCFQVFFFSFLGGVLFCFLGLGDFFFVLGFCYSFEKELKVGE